MSHGRAHRSTSEAVAGLAAFLLVGLGLVGPAYPAKPVDPPGRANAGAVSAHEKANADQSANGANHSGSYDSTSKGVLPDIGSPRGVLMTGFAGLALFAGGTALTRRRKY